MGDSFVDVTYRGLEVGRRLRIREFSADGAYVEAPTPMPVGTSLDLATDAGVTIKAIVARVHEQIGGSDRPPGMNVRAIVTPELRAWWDARMSESPAPVPVPVPVPVPASADRTAPASPESGPVMIEEDGARTQVMAAIDPDALADPGGNGEIVDDGKRTQMMSVAEIDEIVAQASGDVSGEHDITGEEDVSQDGPATNGNGNGTSSSKKKRRRKKK